MKKCMVTGGLGFVGRRLVERLLADGHKVTVVDKKSVDGTEGTNCNVVTTDIARYERRPRERYDYVFHLADVVGPYTLTELGGSIGPQALANIASVLRICDPGESRLILVSSSEVYGRAGSFTESEPAHIRVPYTMRLEYGASKILEEIVATNFGIKSRLDVCIVRPFNISGPGQSPDGGFVLPRFFEAAIAGRPLTVFGNGRQVRCFTHVDDIVDSLMIVAASGRPGGIYNSGNPDNRVNIGNLARLVVETCSSTSDIINLPPQSVFGELYSEAFDKVPNISRMVEEFGWRPKKSLKEILSDIARHYAVETPSRATASVSFRSP